MSDRHHLAKASLCLALVVITAGCGEVTNRFAACESGQVGRFGCSSSDALPSDAAGGDGSDDGGSDLVELDASDDVAVDRGPDDVAVERGPDDADLSAQSDVTEADAGSDAGEDPDVTELADATDPADSADTNTGPCPTDMQLVGAICMDRYEAPNVAGGLPLVMYSYYEAEDWCEARGRRLCTDVEWTTACEGAAQTAFPYGDTRVAGLCNDEEIWRTYSQSSLNNWPPSASSETIETLDELFAAVRANGSGGTVAADHVEWLYQGEGAGTNEACVNEHGVYDLIGNVEEWTTRADGGGGAEFSGNLKGRYWAESRDCHDNIRSHGNAFRFYEIGFRCCVTP